MDNGLHVTTCGVADLYDQVTNIGASIYSGLAQSSIRGIAFMNSLPFRQKLLDPKMAEPAPEAQPQVPRAPEANVVRDIVVDPALARAAQDTNLQKVM